MKVLFPRKGRDNEEGSLKQTAIHKEATKPVAEAKENP